jgi:hypothetical protein
MSSTNAIVHLSSAQGGLPGAMVSQSALLRQCGAIIAARNGLGNNVMEILQRALPPAAQWRILRRSRGNYRDFPGS